MIDTGGMIIYQKQDWEQIKYSNYQVENITMYLKSLGIKEINTLILTHGDVDHLGNALELIEKIPIKTVYLNHNKQTKVEQEIVKKVPLISYEKLNNSFFRIEDYSLNAMSADENEASLILKLQVYQTVFLMMGDAPKKQENLLPNNFHADVLKVGHHGSNTSTSENLLKKVKPTIAVISVGLNNRYHHPHEEVIKLLKKSHAQIYQTSKEGSVTFKLNNYTLQIS